MNNLLPYPWQMSHWDMLMQQLAQHRMPHALLVAGEEGCGKRHFVDVLIRKLLCSSSQEFACGECKSCLLFQAGTHPGYMDVGLEEKSRLIKIDQIRSVVEFISKTVQIGDIKIAVIEPAEQMNANAANALLKCLEEPSGNSLIILLSHAPNRLLPTIRSRCHTIAMVKPEIHQADQWLSAFLPESQVRQQVLQLANGNPLLAMEYADREIISLYQGIVGQLADLQEGKGAAVKMAESVEKSVNGDIPLWLALQQKILWKMITESLGAEQPDPQLQIFEKQYAKQGFQKKAFKMLEEIQQAIYEVQGPSNPNMQLLIETLLIRWRALLLGS